MSSMERSISLQGVFSQLEDSEQNLIFLPVVQEDGRKAERVFVFGMDGKNIQFLARLNQVYAGTISGLLEEGEGSIRALMREAWEEYGIVLDPTQISMLSQEGMLNVEQVRPSGRYTVSGQGYRIQLTPEQIKYLTQTQPDILKVPFAQAAFFMQQVMDSYQNPQQKRILRPLAAAALLMAIQKVLN